MSITLSQEDGLYISKALITAHHVSNPVLYKKQAEAANKLMDVLQSDYIRVPMAFEALIKEYGDLQRPVYGKDIKLPDGVGSYGVTLTGKYYLVRFSPAGKVGKGWHKSVLGALSFRPSKALLENIYNVGQHIIDLRCKS